MDSQSSQLLPPPSRDYKCPCGKTYLSYPAIFTHIKQKHAGKSPGPIQKPKLQSKPRGRPPLSSKKQTIKDDKTADSKKKEEESGLNLKLENHVNYKYLQEFRKVFGYLKEIEYREYIEKNIWDNFETFQKFQQFIDSKKVNKDFKYLGVSIGIGLSEFLKSVTVETESWRFEQVLILFMLLLQYTIDENNDPNIISEAPIQFFVEYMNPFIKQFIEDESDRLGIQSLWIMNLDNMNKIFLCFYNWLKWKQYTQYCITLIGD